MQAAGISRGWRCLYMNRAYPVRKRKGCRVFFLRKWFLISGHQSYLWRPIHIGGAMREQKNGKIVAFMAFGLMGFIMGQLIDSAQAQSPRTFIKTDDDVVMFMADGQE